MKTLSALAFAGLVAIGIWMTGCTSEPPPPANTGTGGAQDSGGGGGSGSTGGGGASTGGGDSGGSGGSGGDTGGGGGAPAPEKNYSPELHDKFKQLSTLVDEVKAAKAKFHENESDHAAWETCSKKIDAAFELQASWPEADEDYPQLQETLATLGQVNSDFMQYDEPGQ